MTPQYAGLRALHERHSGSGFNVLAFPCNQFGGQEPGTNEEVLEFARSEYGVEFPMFAKIEVNGADESPVYSFLKAGHPDEGGNQDIAWNFTKFLVGRDGSVLERLGPQVTPEEIEEVIVGHL